MNCVAVKLGCCSNELNQVGHSFISDITSCLKNKQNIWNRQWGVTVWNENLYTCAVSVVNVIQREKSQWNRIVKEIYRDEDMQDGVDVPALRRCIPDRHTERDLVLSSACALPLWHSWAQASTLNTKTKLRQHGIFPSALTGKHNDILSLLNRDSLYLVAHVQCRNEEANSTVQLCWISRMSCLIEARVDRWRERWGAPSSWSGCLLRLLKQGKALKHDWKWEDERLCLHTATNNKPNTGIKWYI